MKVRGPLAAVLAAKIERERERQASAAQRRQEQLRQARLESGDTALRELIDSWYREAMAQRAAAELQVRDEVAQRLRDQREGCWTALAQLARQVATSVQVAPFVGVQAQVLMDDHQTRFDELTDQWSAVVQVTIDQGRQRLASAHRRFAGSHPDDWERLDALYAAGRPLAPTRLSPPRTVAMHSSPVRVLFSEGDVLSAHREPSHPTPEQRRWLFERVRREAEQSLAPREEAPWDVVRSAWRGY